MISVNKTENILDLIQKIEKRNITENSIIIEFPFGHPILYNKLALKSIVEKFKDKQIVIHTANIGSIKIGTPLGIKYSITKDNKKITDNQNILKYNFSFFEYMKYEIKKNILNILDLVLKNKKINKITNYYNSHNNKKKPNIGFYLSIFIISLIVFLFIFYFILNKTYVYITPEIKTQTKSKNFTFIQSPSNTILGEKEERLIKIEKNISLEKTFKTSGVKQSDDFRAKGKVIIINKDLSDTKLRANTRLLAENGVIYETIDWVNIKAGKYDKSGNFIAGKEEVEIRAKQSDEKGSFIGTRGNIDKIGTILTIPGLKDMQNKIYAKTITKIEGGKDIYEKIMGENDLENAKQSMILYLKKKAIEEINKDIELKNTENNIVYNIIGINDAYFYENMDIQYMDNYKPGDKITEFKLKGSLKAYSFIYNLNSLLSKMKLEIDSGIIPDKEKIIYINDKSIRFSEILVRNNNPFGIKATVEIEVFLSHNFDNNMDNYTNRLKKLITGLNKKEAEKILINEEQISNANIEIHPFFINKISNLENNIKFIIE